MKTKIFFAVVSCGTLLSTHVMAETQTWPCGDDCVATLTDDGTMTISGHGEMTNYEYYADIPWRHYGVSEKTTSIVIEKGITSIGDLVFNMPNVRSVTIPNSVTTIGRSAFKNATSLESIEIPDSVTTIKDEAFYGAISLESVEIPNSVISIGNEAFKEIDFNIPKDIQYLGGGNFKGSDLSSIVLPESLFKEDAKGISKFAFDNSQITTIYCPAGNEKCESMIFKQCVENGCGYTKSDGCSCSGRMIDDPISRSVIPYVKDPITGKIMAAGKTYANLFDMQEGIEYVAPAREVKRIYTVDEAEKALGTKGKNTFSIRYR